jgi:site-specific DNA recombinase
MRVATYTRISTDEEHQPYSLEAQAARLQSYIASQDGWLLVRTFSDQKSGASIDRPGLQKALAESRGGRFDLLLVYRVDRFSRSVRGLAQLLEELDRAAVAFRSATEPFDTTTAAGRMMVQMLGVFAEFERATIVDRVVAGMERKAQRGGWNGGSIPFGYAYEPSTGQLVVRDDEAPLIPMIFQQYARARFGAHAISNWLNENGHRTRSGRLWDYDSILTILRNRVYLSEVYFRGVFHPAPHPPLVTADRFDEVQAVLALHGESNAERNSAHSEYLLSGLVRCKRCRRRLIGTTCTGKLQRYRYYTCLGRIKYGTQECDTPRIPGPELDAAVMALLTAYERSELFDSAIAAVRERAHQRRSDHEREMNVVDAQMRQAEEATIRYLRAFEVGALAQEVCGERTSELKRQIEELRARRADLETAIAQTSQDAPSPNELEALQAYLRDALLNDTLPARKALMKALVHEVVVEGRTATPFFVVPGQPENGDGSGVRVDRKLVHPD